MEGFEREERLNDSRTIENMSEAEHVIDKVLSTGQNFYNTGKKAFDTTIQKSRFNKDVRLGSRKSLSARGSRR